MKHLSAPRPKKGQDALLPTSPSSLPQRKVLLCICDQHIQLIAYCLCIHTAPRAQRGACLCMCKCMRGRRPSQVHEPAGRTHGTTPACQCVITLSLLAAARPAGCCTHVPCTQRRTHMASVSTTCSVQYVAVSHDYPQLVYIYSHACSPNPANLSVENLLAAHPSKQIT